MSVRDMVFEAKLGELRKAVGRLPKHLRPTPTCLSMVDAAAAIGVSLTALRRLLRVRRWRPVRIGGVPMLALATVDMLRR